MPQPQEYSGDDFSVRVEPHVREAVSVVYSRRGIQLNLDGERIGSKWEGIKVVIPSELELDVCTILVNHLEVAFKAFGLDYLIIRPAEVESVNETDSQAAIAALRDMGFEIELSTDRKQAGLHKAPGHSHQDPDTLKKQSQRMLSLIQDIRGTRQPFQILAKSKEF